MDFIGGERVVEDVGVRDGLHDGAFERSAA
jgi:hypothetical protein